MTDIANHTLELLRKFRDETAARFNKVDLSLRDLTEQARITNAHVAALVQHENFATTKFHELEARVERIEKRLDLVDPNLPEQSEESVGPFARHTRPQRPPTIKIRVRDAGPRVCRRPTRIGIRGILVHAISEDARSSTSRLALRPRRSIP